MSRSKNVMIVDDDEDIRDTLVDSLEDSGYHTLAAGNGEEALEVLRRGERPCVILLDIMMPVLDGWGFRSAQRDDPSLSTIPVVVVTAVGDAGEQARRMGAAAALQKPFDLAPLLDTIGRLCG